MAEALGDDERKTLIAASEAMLTLAFHEGAARREKK